ncbi:hypothetical protein BGZ93_003395 [Podila epicladia]|nr:hypothetical protein BGZ92_004162 [Podila epicladia]KAG0100225.1 hypothetical protein BGZ93_003395 [Podila epicladia]
MASGDEQQRRRHRLLSESNDPNPAAQGQDVGISSHRLSVGPQHPLSTAITAQQQDITSTIRYMTDILRPQRVKQQKHLPKVCMIHQLYSLVADHTAVDRALAHQIKVGQIRKFYLGGTGSDEFAIMLTPDYLEQIRQAKQHYLNDIKASLAVAAASTIGANKRKTEQELEIGSRLTKKGVVHTKSTAKMMKINAPAEVGEDDTTPIDTIFDRFELLISSGSCVEVSIQHSNLQAFIGATEEDITTLMHYSLLTRGLAAPANPHLVNLQPASASSSPGPSGGSGGGHHALNQLIATANMEKSKEITSSSTSSTSLATAPMVTPSITRTVIPGAAIGAAARASKRRPADNVAYRFSFPKGGLFVTHFLKGRLEILRTIKRQMFGDILVSTLESKPLRGSILPHEFHIHDLIGSGRVERYLSPSSHPAYVADELEDTD